MNWNLKNYFLNFLFFVLQIKNRLKKIEINTFKVILFFFKQILINIKLCMSYKFVLFLKKNEYLINFMRKTFTP